ncbi:MAG TPA: zinc-dependent metalloprotease, partial [Gemmatimonadales bacterium]|nr:zinc-dependent metalloprotease [Gemmatimonadales bacterium]
MSHTSKLTAVATALALVAGSAHGQQPGGTQRPASIQTDIAAATRGMERLDGFVPVVLDAEQGRVFLEVRDSLRALVFFTLATGLGSNAIGLDRGADGPSHVVRFVRVGPRVLVQFENWGYRSSGDARHQRTVLESFPPSTVAALPITAAQEGRLLVDATDFLLRDWMSVALALQSSQQGGYSIARDRSYVNRPLTRAFPTNTEIDVALTFATTGRPGSVVSTVTPDGSAFTLRQHVSLLALPDDGYRPRRHDPRAGFNGVTFRDYAQPIQSPLEQRWIARHRLERTDPRNPRSPIANPIVYYVDPGIPEPIRTATLEGARFWEEAFARAGLPGGFRVELLPDTVDPMDARYNVVQWENRHERGWSIGGSLRDPRTGQIIKAMARMDSHRARTDYQIYAALMGAAPAAADTAFVLGRVRQVTAHEIGHTLGLSHNYIASSYERGSVMDYPPPRVRLSAGGEIDISAAYARGPGEYDVWAVRWGYGIFPPGEEEDSLRAIMAEGLRRGLLFLSDGDARPDFASDPRVNLWDDAGTAEEFMRHQVAVRRAAMGRFGLRNSREGEPVALLQDRFSYVYFWHRWAISSLARVIGGMEYHHAVAGDGQPATRWIASDRQRAALRDLVAALEPAELDVPDTVITLLGPRPF